MGLLDWLTDGSLGSMGGMTGETGAPQPMTDMPQPQPAQQPDPPPLPPSATPAATTPTPDPTPAAGPPDPPIPLPAPRPPGADQTFAPNQTNTNPISPPAPGFNPSPIAAGGGALTPDDARAAVKSYQAAGGHAFDGYVPTAGSPTSLAPPAPGPAAAPYKLGDQTALGRALGIDPKSQAFNTALTGLGSGLTAAGNSKGKSPFQAFSSGAGASIEGASKEAHAANKDAQGYLTAAINARKAGDDATYKTNYTNYLAAKLKSDQLAAANKDAAVANKNDSPTQLYLSAQRNVAADPLVKGAYTAYQNALKTGNGPNDPEVQKAKAAYEQTVQERQAAHLAGVGLHPQTAAEVAKQPGMTQANPVDAGAQGITAANIGKKLQPGQYYKNPADGKVYQYKGSPSKSDKASSATPAVSKPEPANPLKPDKVPASAGADEDD